MQDPVEKKQKSGDRLYETILENIKKMIVDNSIKPGEKLPSERELAEMFHVSRIPVREAIKILEYMEIVENKQGDGMYLKTSSKVESMIGKASFSNEMTSDVMVDLFEMRIMFETRACICAAERRTDEDIVAMQNAIAAMRETINDLNRSDGEHTPYETEKARAVSHQFHTCLIEAAHNTVLSVLYTNLFELLDVSKQLTIGTAVHSRNSTLAHELILSKIIDRDGESAARAMLDHLSDARDLALRHLRDENSAE